MIDFAEIAPFPWDRVYIFRPYSSREHIESSLGFHWEGARWTSIDSGKSVNLVVFVRNGTVVSWFEHPRCDGDMLDLDDPNGFAREQAQFRVRAYDNGWLVLLKSK
jgi:hypothetical protein